MVNIKSFFKWIINFILIAVLIYSGYNIYEKLSEYNKANSVYNEIRQINNDSNNDKSDINEKLFNINKDFVFWIKLDNTNIDYPVVQGKDNNYYLNKDFYGKDSSSGAIFMDSCNDFDSDKNVVLYGHNMKNKTMFSQIERFKDEYFWNENNKIRIFKDSKELIYEVFSVYVAKSSDDYLRKNFDKEEDFTEYINEVKSKSLYSSNVTVHVTDKIITLSTCSYEFKNARTVVYGKQVN